MQAEVFPDGRITLRNQIFRAALGRGGVKVHKVEGDEATPAGVLPLRRVLYRADRQARPDCPIRPDGTIRPDCAIRIEPLAPNELWCDDPGHRDYNKMVRAPHEGRHEELWRSDDLYDIVGVLGWNDQPVIKGLGSAIFLHVAQRDLAPTSGCIALALPELRRLLAMGVTGFLVHPV